MPILVMIVCAALVVWAVLLFIELRRQSFRLALLFGVGLCRSDNVGCREKGNRQSE